MNQKTSLRASRVFSEALKKKVVKDIESGKVSVLAASREYSVSFQAIYQWLNKYSRHLQTSKRIVVEMQSESYKSRELEKRIQELEAALGRKQLEVDFLNKMIELGSEQTGVDIKKKFSTPPSTGSGSTNKGTSTK
jgi:transposase-like protein